MGFHLVEKVYSNVTGTSSTAQAVLAFLAHRADDSGVRKCFPAVEAIRDATHFGKTAVHGALNELREAGLLSWTSGGRHKGQGGRALANEYTFKLPDKAASRCVREADHAESAKRTMQGSPNGPCTVREANTINPDQPFPQPAVSGDTEAATADLDSLFISVAENWDVKRKKVAETAKAARKSRKDMRHEVVNEAMRVCDVNDEENRKIFSSTLVRRDPDEALEKIWSFESEWKAGERKNMIKPAAVLNTILAQLPIIN